MYSMTTGYGYSQLVARVPLGLDDLGALGASDDIQPPLPEHLPHPSAATPH